jgi:hypothetical protein
VSVTLAKGRLALEFPPGMPAEERQARHDKALERLGIAGVRDADALEAQLQSDAEKVIVTPAARPVEGQAAAEAVAKQAAGMDVTSPEDVEGHCEKVTASWQTRLAEEGVFLPAVLNPQRPRADGTMDNVDHRFLTDGKSVIGDGTIGQFMTPQAGEDPKLKKHLQPFVGNYDLLRQRIADAMADGVLAVDGATPEEVLIKHWGVAPPGENGELRFIADIKKQTNKDDMVAEQDEFDLATLGKVSRDDALAELRGEKKGSPPGSDDEAPDTERPVETKVSPGGDGPEIDYRELEGGELQDLQLEIDGAENTAHLKERARAAAEALPPSDRAAYDDVVKRAETNLQVEMLERALAAGNQVSEVAEMAGKLAGKSDQEVLDVLTGKAIIQASGHSCVPASLQIAIAQADPVFAMMMVENPELMAKMQRAAMDRIDATFSQRFDLDDLPPEVRAAIARNPALGEVLDDPARYHEDGTRQGMTASQMRESNLKARLDGTADADLKVMTPANLADAGDGQYQGVPHDEIQERLGKAGGVPFAANGHARTITGSFHDEHGNLCYNVRDPDTGHPSVITAADLDKMDMHYIVLEEPRQVFNPVDPVAQASGDDVDAPTLRPEQL